MVELEEVEDAHFQKEEEDEGDWDTDSDSDVSSVAVEDVDEESLLDRVAALKDVIPPLQRRRLANAFSTTSEWGIWGATAGGRALWVVLASALMLGVPFALATTEEAQIEMQEKEMSMQRSAQDMMTPGVQPGSAGSPQQAV